MVQIVTARRPEIQIPASLLTDPKDSYMRFGTPAVQLKICDLDSGKQISIIVS